MAQRILAQPAPVIVYASERTAVTRYAPDEFGLSLDGVEVNTYRTQAEAEHEGALWVEQQARELAATLADERAATTCDRCGATPAPHRLTNFSTRQRLQLCAACAAGPWDDLSTDAPGDDDPETGPSEISLTAIKRRLEQLPTVRTLSALVYSAYGQWQRGLRDRDVDPLAGPVTIHHASGQAFALDLVRETEGGYECEGAGFARPRIFIARGNVERVVPR